MLCQNRALLTEERYQQYFVADLHLMLIQATPASATIPALSTASLASHAKRATVLSTRLCFQAGLSSRLFDCITQGLGASYLGVAETAIQVTSAGMYI